MKKQPKPETLLDKYLETIGLKRKPIAKDGLCLFRAVSEQLFLTQVYHTNLYEACKMVLIHCGKDPVKEWTESKVMEILSLMYRRDFLIYETVGQFPKRATKNNFEKKIYLCRVHENQLDSVYTVGFFEQTAICQSIIYDVLYRDVFGLDTELTEAVELIREQNKKKTGMYEVEDLNTSFREISISSKERNRKKVVPPVPYRIAKALDPTIYRNVELDIWEEEKRELIKQSPEYRERFATGDKCQVSCEGEHSVGHIQEINDQDNTAVVFIEEFGEKRVVPISCLKLQPQHKYHLKRRKQFLNLISQSSSTRASQYSCSPITRQQTYQLVPYQDSEQQATYTELDEYNYNINVQDQLYSGESYILGNPYYPEGEYSGSVYYTMDNVNQTNGVTTYIQNGKTNTNQYYTPSPVQYYRPSPASGPIMTPYYYGSVIPQSNCVQVPYVENMAIKDINMNCIPAQGYNGKDLQETNTFYSSVNTGIENYRMVYQNGAMWPVMEMNGYNPQSEQVNQTVGISSGQFALPPPPLLKTLSPSASHNFQHNFSTNQNFKVATKQQGKEVNGKCGEVVSINDKDSPSKDSIECSDSGCDSDSIRGSTHNESFKDSEKSLKESMELEKNIDNFIASKDEDVIQNGAFEESVTSTSDTGYKQKTKKKYYMYGSLKLVKPIKDIPPRFLSLLSDSSAERARCEGEPIIIPFLPPKKHHYYNNHNSNTNVDKATNNTTVSSSSTSTSFNPEAKCFVPGQMQSAVMHDPSIVAYCFDSTKPDQMAIMDSTGLYNGSNPVYLPVQNTNNGNGSHSTQPSSLGNHCNSLLGDGSKVSMHPSFSTGQACSTYIPSVPYPVYFTGGPMQYPAGQGYIANGSTGSDMQMYYTTYNHGSQTYNMPSQLPQLPAIQSAQ